MEYTNLLNIYAYHIINFENKLKKLYNIKDDMDLYERIREKKMIIGTIDNYKYNFHGAGCSLIFNGLTIEYDFMPFNNYKIKFSIWKFSQFLITYFDLNHLDQIQVKKNLDELVKNKKLTKLKISGREFDIYQFNPIARNYFPDSTDL